MDRETKPITTLDAGDGGGWNNCMLSSAIAAVPLEFNVGATNDVRLSTPDPIPHPSGGWVEHDGLNAAAASMRAVLADIIQTSVDSPLYGELANMLPYFALEGVNDPFLSTSVQACQNAGQLDYTDAQLREMANCIARNVRDVSRRPARMMANVELAYWTIYLAQKGVTLETIGDPRQDFHTMDGHLTNHLRMNDGKRLVVIFNDGHHYRLVADPRWINDVYTVPGSKDDDSRVARDLAMRELKDDIIAELYGTVADENELERRIEEVNDMGLEELTKYGVTGDSQVNELKAALVNRIRGLATDKARMDDMIATVNDMKSVDEIVQYDELLDIMMTGGASKARGYIVPAALAMVTLVMSMVPR